MQSFTTYNPNGAFLELLRNFMQIPKPIGDGAGIPTTTRPMGSTCEGMEAPVTMRPQWVRHDLHGPYQLRPPDIGPGRTAND